MDRVQVDAVPDRVRQQVNLRLLIVRFCLGRFVSQMALEEKQEAKRQNTAHLRDALAPPCDLLILDEACAAWQLDMVDRALLRSAVLERPEGH